jgi:hypothetical protein
MRIILKLVATLFGFETAVFAVMLAANVMGLERALPPAKLVTLVALLGLASFATVQVWRLKHSGRYAGLGLIVLVATLMVLTRPGGQPLSLGDVMWAGYGAVIALTLAIPSAKRACS